MMHAGVILSLLLSVSAAAGAAPIQALADIESAVRTLVTASGSASGDVEVSLGRLDPRLQLPRCDQALDARFTQTRRLSGPLSVEVRCEGIKPWALYVPVTLERYAEVVVAARPVARGAPLSAEDLRLARRRVDVGRRDYLEQAEAAVGQIAARGIASGEILGQQQLRRPRLVRRGDHVVLSVGSSTVSVSMKGEALADGSAGERIRVRNLSSARVVEGTVTAAGVVVVAGGAML